MSNINSSFSDDGGRRSEGDKGYSLQVEFSDRGKPNEGYYVNRISEEEFESERERRSSPPGTIGDVQDIMSENIESQLKLLRKKPGQYGVQTINNGGPHSIGNSAFESKWNKYV